MPRSSPFKPILLRESIPLHAAAPGNLLWGDPSMQGPSGHHPGALSTPSPICTLLPPPPPPQPLPSPREGARAAMLRPCKESELARARLPAGFAQAPSSGELSGNFPPLADGDGVLQRGRGGRPSLHGVLSPFVAPQGAGRQERRRGCCKLEKGGQGKGGGIQGGAGLGAPGHLARLAGGGKGGSGSAFKGRSPAQTAKSTGRRARAPLSR